MVHKFIILDAARLGPNLDEAKSLDPSSVSLYQGEMERELVNFFPFLFSFEEGSALADWYFTNGWGQSWGVILQSEYNMQETATHLKKSILVNTEDEKDYFFRFYDPRVLRIFLTTCNSNQLREFFGPVEYFICEDIDPEFGLMYSFEENSLQTKRISKEELKGKVIKRKLL